MIARIACRSSGIGTIGPVDGHAASARDIADDFVARQRIAAVRQAHEDVVKPLTMTPVLLCADFLRLRCPRPAV